MADINSHEEIITLVDSFYDRIKEDELLGPVFNHFIQGNWTPHLETMYTFWQNILLDENAYHGQPFATHARVNQTFPLTSAHFNRWLELFNETVDELFVGPQADKAKFRAKTIGLTWDAKFKFLNEQAKNN